MMPKAILFDWDNTLIDTLPLIHEAHNAVRQQFGLPLWTREEAHLLTQRAGREGFQVHYGEKWDVAEEIFYAHFRAHHLESIALMPAATDILEWLQMEKIPMAVISNKKSDILQKEINHLKLEQFFVSVLGVNDVGKGKPDPAGILMALRKLSIEPRDAWYAGDTEADMQASQAAGVISVFIGHNRNNIAPQPDFSFANCAECLDYLKTLGNSAQK